MLKMYTFLKAFSDLLSVLWAILAQITLLWRLAIYHFSIKIEIYIISKKKGV